MLVTIALPSLALPGDAGTATHQRHKTGKYARRHEHRATSVAINGPVYKGPPVLAQPAIPACSRESALRISKTYNLKGWDIPTPNFGNSITQDYDCWRTNLAEKYGISIMAYNTGQLYSNLINHYVPPSGTQQYAGQRATGAYYTALYATYDLSRWGIPDGQFQLGGFTTNSTYIKFQPNNSNLLYLAYYQTFFNRMFEVNVGYIPLNNVFVGTQVGGNVFNILGANATLPVLTGASNFGDPTPAAIVKWNLPDHFYDKAGIARSAATTVAVNQNLSPVQAENYSNPASIKFTNAPYVFGVQYPTERPLYINEIGYKNDAAPNDPATWVRFTSFYNSSDYNDLAHSGHNQVNDYALLLYGDRQIWQTNFSSPGTAYQGVYVGGTVAYASPYASSISQDYQFRLYEFGMFNRPFDQLSFIYEHETYSHFLANSADAAASCLSGTSCFRHGLNQYTVVYNANIVPGVFLGMGVSYVDHPAAAWSPNGVAYGSATAPVVPQLNINHALNFLASAFINY
ncbi:MAG: carbohydrate porin [Pseudomonadota bacterium]